ncbi:hypothetical protein B0H16DRAFT_896705 [Mycena metata]|uniref:Uncharacterized protein n=1 Tax=Mycena metata TaxID=1033252 RepID=A0AAD7GGG1_9AGAR|nr:hypothetical protein B0H16DRAFT_896705 [Mycena metata]
MTDSEMADDVHLEGGEGCAAHAQLEEEDDVGTRAGRCQRDGCSVPASPSTGTTAPPLPPTRVHRPQEPSRSRAARSSSYCATCRVRSAGGERQSGGEAGEAPACPMWHSRSSQSQADDDERVSLAYLESLLAPAPGEEEGRAERTRACGELDNASIGMSMILLRLPPLLGAERGRRWYFYSICIVPSLVFAWSISRISSPSRRN